jgi:hypothetical protein
MEAILKYSEHTKLFVSELIRVLKDEELIVKKSTETISIILTDSNQNIGNYPLYSTGLIEEISFKCSDFHNVLIQSIKKTTVTYQIVQTDEIPLNKSK